MTTTPAWTTGYSWWWDCPDPAMDGPHACAPYPQGSAEWRDYLAGWNAAVREAKTGEGKA